MNALTNGATIIVISNNARYHTLDTWGLAIGNTDCISQPEQETNYIYVPAMDGFLDLSESLSGRPIFKSRSITMEMGGIREAMNWDAIMSDLRNKIHGRKVKLIFDNDEYYYWQGRIYVDDFTRAKRLGRFTLSIPMADPYKYDLVSSIESWLWDPFNFLTGVIKNYSNITVVGSTDLTIPSGLMPVSPTFTVRDITSDTFTVTYDGTTYTMVSGENYFPEIIVNAENEVELTFTGSAVVTIDYRGGSL